MENLFIQFLHIPCCRATPLLKTYMYKIVKDLNVYYHLRDSHYLNWKIQGKPPYNIDLFFLYLH